jgi:hypothetical protein
MLKGMVVARLKMVNRYSILPEYGSSHCNRTMPKRLPKLVREFSGSTATVNYIIFSHLHDIAKLAGLGSLA